MLVVSGFISAQNADIVIESLDELATFIASSQRSTLSESVSLNREDLDVPTVLFNGRIRSQRIAVKDVKDGTETSDINSLKDMGKSRPQGQDSLSMSPRKQVILQVLKAGGECGIRDVAASLPQYSEKMIQRELAEMTDIGLVRKSGLKRWSKYAVNTTI